MHSYYSSAQPSGENLVVDAEAAALRRAGFDVRVVSLHTDEASAQTLYGARSALRVATGRGADPLSEIHDHDSDVVHIHNLFPNFGRRWVEQLDVPMVHTLHNYRPLCANGLMLRDGQVCSKCPDGERWAGVRHRCYRSSRLATLPQAWANRKGPMTDPVIRRADQLLVLSGAQRDIYVDAGVPSGRLTIVPHFLPERLDPGQQKTTSKSREGWVFVGRFSEEKGIVRLLGKWPVGEPLKVIGDGPQRAEVERLAQRVGAVVTGPLPRQRVVEAMTDAMGVVVPSILETFGLVYLEAMAAGAPVVAFAPTVVAEAVKRDGTGATLDWSGDLQKALSDVRQDNAALSPLCRQVFERTYSEASYIARTRSLYRSLVDSRRS